MKKSFGGKIVVCSDFKMALNFQIASKSIKPQYIIVQEVIFIAINLVKKGDYHFYHIF